MKNLLKEAERTAYHHAVQNYKAGNIKRMKKWYDVVDKLREAIDILPTGNHDEIITCEFCCAVYDIKHKHCPECKR